MCACGSKGIWWLLSACFPSSYRASGTWSWFTSALGPLKYIQVLSFKDNSHTYSEAPSVLSNFHIFPPLSPFAYTSLARASHSPPHPTGTSGGKHPLSLCACSLFKFSLPLSISRSCCRPFFLLPSLSLSLSLYFLPPKRSEFARPSLRPQGREREVCHNFLNAIIPFLLAVPDSHCSLPVQVRTHCISFQE